MAWAKSSTYAVDGVTIRCVFYGCGFTVQIGTCSGITICGKCIPRYSQIFLRYSSDPVALVAPVYKPFLDEDGNVSLGAPVLRFSAEVYTERVNVDIYLVSDPLGGAFFFLVDAEIFRNRTRGQIYSWQRSVGQHGSPHGCMTVHTNDQG